MGDRPAGRGAAHRARSAERGRAAPQERGTQRLFTQLARFNHYLPPTGRFTLKGPEPADLPTGAEGAYMILLRIEASDDKEAESSRWTRAPVRAWCDRVESRGSRCPPSATS